MTRDPINERDIDAAALAIVTRAKRRLAEKSPGAYVGMHETYGILEEEREELQDAMHINDTDGFIDEMIDVAVVCVLGLASSQTWGKK